MNDRDGKIWGLPPGKLRPEQMLELTNDWQTVPEGCTIPGGVEVKLDLATGARLARLAQEPAQA